MPEARRQESCSYSAAQKNTKMSVQKKPSENKRNLPLVVTSPARYSRSTGGVLRTKCPRNRKAGHETSYRLRLVCSDPGVSEADDE